MPGHDIVAIGASAGGVQAILQLAEGLPEDLPAALFVVVHTAPNGPASLAGLVTRLGPLPALFPRDGEAIENGRIYIAPPDRHLLLEPGFVRVVPGPRENRSRPAIDPLFRSAARAYGPRVIGVVLTGMLDDGSAGLRAIKDQGGVAVVQDPADAAYPEMPRNAKAAVEVDHCVPLRRLPPLLAELAGMPPPPPIPLDQALLAGHAMALGDRQPMERVGQPSAFACPECGGVLWEIDEAGAFRFRCRVGHAYAPENLSLAQEEQAEAAMWAGLRALEEGATLKRRMAQRFRNRHDALEERFAEEARRNDEHAGLLRRILTAPGEEGLAARELARPGVSSAGSSDPTPGS